MLLPRSSKMWKKIYNIIIERDIAFTNKCEEGG